MTERRNVLTPDALTMMDVIARTGSFAAAARELGKVPSALTYSVRQLEEALDVLLFDRSSRQARLTAAGDELLHEGRALLEQMDAVANRVKRVATGWETQLRIAYDSILSSAILMELCESFYALHGQPIGALAASGAAMAQRPGPGTRLRLQAEVMAGTWEALTTGAADLAIGVNAEAAVPLGMQIEPLGEVSFVFAVSPHHALAAADSPISDAELMRHRAIAVADSAMRLAPQTVNLLPGQDVLTVSSVPDKVDAHLRGLGCGFLSEPMVRDHVANGRLVVKTVERRPLNARLGYAWRSHGGPSEQRVPQGLALQWWLKQLESPTTRTALLERHGG
jgi:DNA-binding transcriptional LysR family regulator